MATSVLELHRLCAETAGVEQEPQLNPERPGDLRRSVLDVSLAQRELGWQAETTLPDGLARTWDWVRTQ
jgi:UDP-glucose 4-epimerase